MCGFEGKLLRALRVNKELVGCPLCARSIEAMSVLEGAGDSEGSSRSHRVTLVYLEQRYVEETPSEGANKLVQVTASPAHARLRH